MVADLDAGDALADLGDDAGALVAEDATGRAAGWCPFMQERSEWHTPVASILTLTSPAPDVDELDVVADLEGGVPDVAEQCSAHAIPLGGRRRTVPVVTGAEHVLV